MPKIKALSPVEVKWNKPLVAKSVVLFLVELIFWVILLIAAINVICYYFNSIKLSGWLNKETFTVSIYLIIGAYFFLIVSKKQIYEALGIKMGLPYIHVGNIKGEKCQNQ